MAGAPSRHRGCDNGYSFGLSDKELGEPMQTRRNFLKRTAAASALVSLSDLSNPLIAETPTTADKEVEWRNRQNEMAYRRLGRTGFMVSEVVMGGNEIRPDRYEHILMALDMGLNYIDTSPAYGRGGSELGLANIIKARPRDSFFLTSKVSVWDDHRNQKFRSIFDSLPEQKQAQLLQKMRDELHRRGVVADDYLVNYFGSQRGELEAAMLSNVMEEEYGNRIDRPQTYKQTILDSVEASLKRLGTDHLDIIMCPHGASSPEELNHPEIFEAFDILKKAGKVRHLGVSSHSDPAGVLKAAVDSEMYSMAMVAYNVANHRFMREAIKSAKGNDFGVIAMKVARAVHPGPGRGTPKPQRVAKLQSEVAGQWSIPQKAYLWGLNNDSLSAVISNMVDDKQVKENLPLPVERRKA